MGKVYRRDSGFQLTCVDEGTFIAGQVPRERTASENARARGTRVERNESPGRFSCTTDEERADLRFA